MKKLARDHPELAKKKKRDPGVPAAWPFKEQVLAEVEEHRAKEAELKQQQKDRRKAALEKKRKQNAKEVQEVSEEYKPKLSALGARRLLLNDIMDTLQTADVIVEVLDARDPLGTRCEDLSRLAQEMEKKQPSLCGRQCVLVLNKIDLVPAVHLSGWLSYLRASTRLPVFLFKSSLTPIDAKGLNVAVVDDSVPEAARPNHIVGASALISYLKSFTTKFEDARRVLNVAVVGCPNTGKSSVVNALAHQQACEVTSAPRCTAAAQQVKVYHNMRVIDTPAVEFASGYEQDDLVLRNFWNLERLQNSVAIAEHIYKMCNKEALMEVYRIAAFDSFDEFVSLVSAKKGKFGKGGQSKPLQTARAILKDWVTGFIPHSAAAPKAVSKAKPAPYSSDAELNTTIEQSNQHALSVLPKRPASAFAVVPSREPLKMDDGQRREEEEQKSAMDEDDEDDEEEDSEDDEEEEEKVETKQPIQADSDDDEEDDDEEEQEESEEESEEEVVPQKKARAPAKKSAPKQAAKATASKTAASKPKAKAKSAASPKRNTRSNSKLNSA